MIRLLKKYQNIYLFLITLSIIGFITGYFYYKVQDEPTKTSIKESINIENTLSNGVSNIKKRAKENSIILISSLLILPIILNVAKTFTIPFEIGFITAYLTTYKLKFLIIYLSLYYIIPYIITLILIRISISIALKIIGYLIFKEQKTKTYIKKQILKYLIITIIILSYELIISIFSYNINLYLMAFLS